MIKNYFITASILFFLIFLTPVSSYGQVKAIKGKVIDAFDFTAIPEVKIQRSDTTQLGMTDEKGNFRIELAAGADELLLSFLGMEWTSVKVPLGCSYVEIIMMADGTYDYMTVRKINKKRYKLFKDLPNKHRQAYEKGIFTSNVSCATYIFRKY